jgi:hypothetical protein
MAIKANLVIDQGTDYSTSISLQNDQGEFANLVGYTANAQIRKTYTSSNAHTFTTFVDDTSGIVLLSLTDTQTANISAGRYVYDVYLTDSLGVVSRIVEGIVTITPRVTR